MKKLLLILGIVMLAGVCLSQVFFGGGGQNRKGTVGRFVAPAPPPNSGGFWWVATNGQANASGSFSDPWSFAYAEVQTTAKATEYIAFKNSGTYTSGSTNFTVVYAVEPVDADPPVNTFLIQIR